MRDGNEEVDMGSCALLTTSCLQLQLRLHEFFMGKQKFSSYFFGSLAHKSLELALNIDPIDVSLRDSFTSRDLTSRQLEPNPRQLRIKSERR